MNTEGGPECPLCAVPYGSWILHALNINCRLISRDLVSLRIDIRDTENSLPFTAGGS
jgi:hypothetical protein